MIRFSVKNLTLFIIFLFVFIPGIYADKPLFYKEAMLVGGYSKADGFVAETNVQRNSVGFEYFQKFSNDYGDFLTLDLQLRTSYDSGENRHYAWGVEFHNAYLEYKLGLGHNIRVGHFDPSFGIEPVVDTHGTMLQTLAMQNIGFKKDWGVGLRGIIGPFDYEITGGLGSGMGIRFVNHNYLLTARIGSPRGNTFQYGLSLLWGDVLKSKQMRTIPNAKLMSRNNVRERRIGVDAQYLWGPCLFKGEFTVGQNDSDEIMGVWAEADYTVPQIQNLELKLQGRWFSNQLNNSSASDVSLAASISYKLTSSITLRAAYFGDLHSYEKDKDHQVFLQVYYFGL